MKNVFLFLIATSLITNASCLEAASIAKTPSPIAATTSTPSGQGATTGTKKSVNGLGLGVGLTGLAAMGIALGVLAGSSSSSHAH